MFCEHCGKALSDEAVMCPNCGAPTRNYSEKRSDDRHIVTKVFMIIGCVMMSLGGFLIPLAWTLPMTIIYFRRTRDGIPIGTGFKICTLLFVSLIAGIIMLCTEDDTRGRRVQRRTVYVEPEDDLGEAEIGEDGYSDEPVDEIIDEKSEPSPHADSEEKAAVPVEKAVIVAGSPAADKAKAKAWATIAFTCSLIALVCCTLFVIYSAAFGYEYAAVYGLNDKVATFEYKTFPLIFGNTMGLLTIATSLIGLLVGIYAFVNAAEVKKYKALSGTAIILSAAAILLFFVMYCIYEVLYFINFT